MRSLRRSCRRRFRRGGRRPLARRRSTGVRGSAEGDRHHHGQREADRDSPQHACQERRAPAAVLGNPHATQPMQASCRVRRRVSSSWLPGAESFLWVLLGELLRYEPARPGVAVPTGLVGLVLLAFCHRSSSRSAVVSIRRFRSVLDRSTCGAPEEPSRFELDAASDVRARPTIGRALQPVGRWKAEGRSLAPPAVKERPPRANTP